MEDGLSRVFQVVLLIDHNMSTVSLLCYLVSEKERERERERRGGAQRRLDKINAATSAMELIPC